LKNYFFNNIAFGQFRFAEFLPAGRQDYRFATRPKGEKKRLAIPPLAELCCFATANRILRERELVFEPRKAWQILSKSGLSARSARAEAQSAEATNAEHTIWLRILNEIRTFFKENPE